MTELIVGIVILLLLAFFLVVLSASLEMSDNEGKSWICYFFKECWDDFRLIIGSVFKKPKDKILILKHLQQFGLYFIEVFFVCGVFLIIANYVSPIDPKPADLFWYGQFMRFLSFYTAYQLFVFTTLNISASAKKDMWLGLNYVIELTLFYAKHPFNEEVEELLQERIEDVLNPYTFMRGKPREMAEEIEEMVYWESFSKENLELLEFYKIQTQHRIEETSSFWHFSFLLNALK